MSLRRILVLVGKEFIHGPKGFIFIWAVIAPLGFTLIATLAFGSLFSDTPKLGIYDQGGSQLVAEMQQLEAVDTSLYGSVEDLREATQDGSVDMGIALTAGFDQAVEQGETVTLEAYVWGQSLAKSRTILFVSIADAVRAIAGQEVPVEIESISLGGEGGAPWSERLLPLLVLMGVFLGGLEKYISNFLIDTQY